MSSAAAAETVRFPDINTPSEVRFNLSNKSLEGDYSIGLAFIKGDKAAVQQDQLEVYTMEVDKQAQVARATVTGWYNSDSHCADAIATAVHVAATQCKVVGSAWPKLLDSVMRRAYAAREGCLRVSVGNRTYCSRTKAIPEVMFTLICDPDTEEGERLLAPLVTTNATGWGTSVAGISRTRKLQWNTISELMADRRNRIDKAGNPMVYFEGVPFFYSPSTMPLCNSVFEKRAHDGAWVVVPEHRFMGTARIVERHKAAALDLNQWISDRKGSGVAMDPAEIVAAGFLSAPGHEEAAARIKTEKTPSAFCAAFPAILRWKSGAGGGVVALPLSG